MTGAGGFVAGTAAGLVRLSPDLEPQTEFAAPPDLSAGRRINDGACDRVGRILFGTVPVTRAGTGTLWSLAPDGTFTALVDGVRMSNGIGFSPDDFRLYHVDSLKQRVDTYRYDPATGSLSGRATLFEVPEPVGLPDGLAVDKFGHVWLAIWGAGAVWRISPDGDHVGTVRVPAARTTSCAFGGADLDRLYITTARDGQSDRESAPSDQDAGAVFVADVGVRGLPAPTAAV